MIKNDAGVFLSVLFCKFARIRKNNFSIPLLQMLRFSRRVKYNDTVYRRICYGFQTKTKEMYEVSFFETSSVLDESSIFMNVSIRGADRGQMKTC